MLLFVYGSLRKGFHNHDYLNEATFINSASTSDEFYMVGRLNFKLDEFEDGRSPPRMLLFPYIFKPDNDDDTLPKTTVYGELYKISDDTLNKIDSHEGHPDIYKRGTINIITDLGEYTEAYTYILESQELKDEILADKKHTRFIPILNGDWSKKHFVRTY